MNKILLVFMFSILLTSLVSAGEFGYNNLNKPTLSGTVTPSGGSSNSTYNATYDMWAYNQTTASGGTDWWYNMSTAAYDMWDSIWSSTYNTTYAIYAYNQTYSGSTYNATYDANQNNATFNQSLTDDLYSGIEWDYNQSTATNTMYGKWWYNMTQPFTDWLSTFIYNYNQTYSGSIYNSTYESTYNATYAGSINNASYLSTYNSSYENTYNVTYDEFAYNQSTPYDDYNYNQTYSGSIYNASYESTYNITYGTYAYNQSEPYDDYNYNMSDGSYNETYDGSINNASYLSTYNATYNSWSYNFTDIVQGVYNVTYNSLTDDSMADTLHRHSELSANDGTPDRAVVVDALGKVGIGGNPLTQLHVQDPTALTIRISNNEVDSTATYGYMLSSQYDSAGESEGTMMIGSANTAEEVNQLWIGGGSSAINAATEIQFYTATDASTRKGTQVMTIDNAGKVGIGVTAPGNDLHVHSTSDTRMLLTNSVTGSTSGDGTYLRQNGVDFYIGNHEIGDLYLFTDNDLSHGVSILTGGNVGIGTYNPTEKLHAVGNALIEGDLNITGNITGNNFYAEGWYHNHTATALSFAVQDVFYNLTMDNFKLNGFTADDSNDLITSQVAGLYKATFSAGGSGENNHEYVTTILINGITQENCEVHKKMTVGGDITTMNGDCFIDLGVGDYVQLGTQDYGATSSGNFYSSNLNLVRIGD